MSQLTLTPEQDVMVLNAVRAKHAQTLSAYGFDDPDLAALLASIESQLTPVMESAPAATEVVEPPEVAIAEAEAEAMEAAEEAPTEE
jgi:hypothetical protein